MKREIIEGLLDRALTEEIGLVVDCTNPGKFEIEVSNFRKNINKYDDLIICMPAIPDTIFIAKRTVELSNVEAPSN